MLNPGSSTAQGGPNVAFEEFSTSQPLTLCKVGYATHGILGCGTWGYGKEGNADYETGALRENYAHGVVDVHTAYIYENGRACTVSIDAMRPFIRNSYRFHYMVPDTIKPDDLEAHIQIVAGRFPEGSQYLDTLYLHFWPGDDRLAEFMHSLAELRTAGLVNHIGVSNFNAEGILAADEHLHSHGAKLSFVTFHFSLFTATPDVMQVVKLVGESEYIGVAWRSTEKGLVGRNLQNKAVDSVSEATGLSTVELSLAYVTSHPHIVTIARMSTNEHREANVRGVKYQLAATQMQTLEEGIPVAQRNSPREELKGPGCVAGSSVGKS